MREGPNFPLPLFRNVAQSRIISQAQVMRKRRGIGMRTISLPNHSQKGIVAHASKEQSAASMGLCDGGRQDRCAGQRGAGIDCENAPRQGEIAPRANAETSDAQRETPSWRLNVRRNLPSRCKHRLVFGEAQRRWLWCLKCQMAVG